MTGLLHRLMTATHIIQAIQSYCASTTGTSSYHRFGISPNVVLTDGALLVAEEAQAFWLMDAIASYITHRDVRNDSFTVWKLLPDPTNEDAATLVCEDGNGKAIVSQQFDYTSFPRDLLPFTFYMQVGSLGYPGSAGWVIMLPQEY